MKLMRSILACLILIPICPLAGCVDHKPLPYGSEGQLNLPGAKRMVWAIAPTLNISGQAQVDPLLQSDLVFQEMQQVHGLTVIPVNRVVEVYAALRLAKVESEQQADLVCNLLGCDALVVPTVTAYDPYEPPKLAASLQLFMKPGNYQRSDLIDPRQLARSATPGPNESVPRSPGLIQAVAMFDAADGSVRDRIDKYAAGRSDPNGPYGEREITASMDRYCAFSYHELIAMLLEDMSPPPATRPSMVAAAR